jgi:putative ABC transport system ATP-binding protein
MLRVEGVTKAYPSRGGGQVLALEQVGFAPAPGSLTAVVGPSGSGKSTLLFTAAGLSRPDAGRVLLGETDVYALSSAGRAALRRTDVGYVFQTFNLVPYLTCEENVALPALLAGRRRAPALGAARGLLGRVGLASRSRHRPAELSVGERQRVAIARSVVNGPQVLLADEPTGNLDPVSAAAVLGLLREIAAEGRTVVLVTHDPGIAGAADVILELNAGRVVGLRDPRVGQIAHASWSDARDGGRAHGGGSDDQESREPAAAVRTAS